MPPTQQRTVVSRASPSLWPQLLAQYFQRLVVQCGLPFSTWGTQCVRTTQWHQTACRSFERSTESQRCFKRKLTFRGPCGIWMPCVRCVCLRVRACVRVSCSGLHMLRTCSLSCYRHFAFVQHSNCRKNWIDQRRRGQYLRAVFFLMNSFLHEQFAA
jgi:hypothetical protein|eukprot:COSAG02_NODE_8237_length_2646_cov_2.141735_2_plen_157_part_00